MASDYRELPAKVAAAIDQLIAADKRAAAQAHRCRRCGHTNTMRVDEAENVLLIAMRAEYLPRRTKAA